MAISLSLSVLTKAMESMNLLDLKVVPKKIVEEITSEDPVNEIHQFSSVCNLLYYSYFWEIMIIWEVILPMLGLVCFFKSPFSETLSWTWFLAVLHANVSVWVWIVYFIFTYNYCWQNIASLQCPDCTTVACTGGIFLGISLVISIIAAIANDQYYPDARLTPREMKQFIAHLRNTNPEITFTLRTHLNAMGEWKRVKKVFHPRQWYDNTVYPDVGQSFIDRDAMVFQISLSTLAKTIEARDDLRLFLWDFSTEHMQAITLEDTEDYYMFSHLHPPNNPIRRQQRPFANRYGRYNMGIPLKFPLISSEKIVRIYVSKSGSLPFYLDILLRFAWILNLLGFSAMVLKGLNNLQSITEKTHIEKRFSERISSSQQRGSEHVPHNPVVETPPPAYHVLVDSEPPKYSRIVRKKQSKACEAKSESETQEQTAEPDIQVEVETDEENTDDGLPTYTEALELA